MDILTKGEQREIKNYIRDRLAGFDPDQDKLPAWLAELEKLRIDHNRLIRAVENYNHLYLRVDNDLSDALLEIERLTKMLELYLEQAENNRTQD